jgi:predicted aspartyl protease
LALVDTGADYLILPDSAALAVGISLAAARIVPVTGLGTTPLSMRRLTVQIELEGHQVGVPALFGQGARALIGRQTLFAALTTLGFSTTEWLFEW